MDSIRVLAILAEEQGLIARYSRCLTHLARWVVPWTLGSVSVLKCVS